MTIYLYIKQHNITKLKYFGKTTRNPYTYKGSGIYWLRHLHKYGRNVSTLKVWKIERQEVCTRFALWFSKKFNIVDSTDWANLVEEAGIDGCSLKGSRNGMYGKLHTEESRKKISDKRKNSSNNNYKGEYNSMFGRNGQSNPFFGKSHSPESLEKMSKAKKGKTYEEIYGSVEKANELRKLRAIETSNRVVSAETRQKLSECNKGKIRTDAQRKNISNAQKGLHPGPKNPRALKIIGISPQGELFHIHGELKLFCKNNFLSYSSVGKILRHNHEPKSGNCVGWRFEYE